MRKDPRRSKRPNGARIGAALLGSAALLVLPACFHAGSTGAPTPTAPAPSQANLIQARSSFFVGPQGFEFPGDLKSPAAGPTPTPQVVGIYSAAEGEKIRDRLTRKGYLIEDTVNSTSRPGQAQRVDLTRPHTYASEYAPAIKGKPSPDDGMFPVTPATPTAFIEREIGIRAKYKGSRSTDEGIEFDLSIERTTLVGSINYGEPITFQDTGFFGKPVTVVIAENRIEMPIFSQRSVHGQVRVKHGDFIAIGGFLKIHPDPKAGPFVAPPEDLGVAENGPFFCLIQVLWVAPGD